MRHLHLIYDYMNLKVLFVVSVLPLIVIGCVSEFDAKLPANDMQTLIVDGSIAGNTEAIFHLSKSFSLDSSEVPAESFDIDAKLIITGSDGYQSPPAINMGKGEYRIAIGELNDDTEYKIRIEYDGDVYESSPAKPLHTPEIDSISWIQPEEYGTVSFYISTHDDAEGTKFFLWNYMEDWEITANQETTIFFENDRFVIHNPAPYYYCWKKDAGGKTGSTESLGENRIVNKELYRIDPSASDRFSQLYCVTVSQRSISREAYEYYQNKIKLNEEMGGLFTPQPSELNGNITCITNPSKRVIGYVEVAKNITYKRKWVERSQVTQWVTVDCSETYTACSEGPCKEGTGCLGLACPEDYATLYRKGYRPVGHPIYLQFPTPLYDMNAYWGKHSCSDCTANGGTKNKPDFWINDHE